jgi:signal transduction histidine kinase/ActR/RegA family two-component response regulator
MPNIKNTEDILQKENDSLKNTENERINSLTDNYDYKSEQLEKNIEIKRLRQEKEILQAQLIQAQKKEMVGNLICGIVHDFNNLLTTIQGNTELALFEINENNPIYHNLKNVQRIIIQAAPLIRKLSIFSQEHIIEKTPINLNIIVDDINNFLRHFIGNDITTTIELDENLMSVLADAYSMEQALMNLIINAKDAMPDGGKILLKTENTIIEDTYCKTNDCARPGKFVKISIKNTGGSIDEEALKYLFKDGHVEGEGLGLSVVKSIIHHHQGWIEVNNRSVAGTTFEIYLPAIPVKPISSEVSMESINILSGHKENVLVVENDPLIMEILIRTLQKSNYKPYPALNAEEALKIYEKENGNFHLLFSEVVMPGMNGFHLVEELKSRKPDLLTILSSDFNNPKAKIEQIREKGIPFIQKPYSLIELLRKIKKMLKTVS